MENFKTLRKGSRGKSVMKLQGFLNLMQDGIFGELTEEAVVEFQRSHMLVPDGIVGPATWSAISNHCLEKSTRTITKIIVHCTATQEGKNFTVEDIRKWHTRKKPHGNGWSDIGYHYIVHLDGSIHIGRNVNIAGAHCSGHNANSIGVVYVGGVDKNGRAKDTRTEAQKQSLLNLLKKLKEKYPAASIHGHRDFAPKSCPSFDARCEYSNF